MEQLDTYSNQDIPNYTKEIDFIYLETEFKNCIDKYGITETINYLPKEIQDELLKIFVWRTYHEAQLDLFDNHHGASCC